MLKLKSARSQALLASLLLLLILGSMSAVAVWRVQSDRAVDKTHEGRATVVAELNGARSEFFLNTNLLVAGALGGDPGPFAEEYRLRRPLVAESIAAARAELTALNETEEIATLDTIGDSIEAMQQDMDAVVAIALNNDQETIIQMAQEYERAFWPKFEALMADTERLVSGEEAKQATEHAAAESASETTLTLLIGLGVAAFLLASAILAMFTTSLLRPLASLQASARAITSGNWEARATVSGPEETASLARDFNEMTETLVERSALLEESEGRFRNVLDVSRDFIYKLNVETGAYDYASPSVLRLTGFTPEEFIAMGFKGVAERAHPEDKILLNMPFRMVLDLSSEDSSVARVEYRWKHKDGEYRWVSDSRSLIRDENGRAIAVVGTVRDETKRKQAEEARRESEEQFRNVLDVSRDLIYRLNLQTRTYDYVSPSSLRLVGFAPQEIVAMGFEGVIERFHPDDRERFRTHPSRLPDDTVEGREAPTIEYRWQCKDGEYRWLSDNRAFVLDEDGRALALVGTVRDITEAMAAEEALQKSIRLLRDTGEMAKVGGWELDLSTKEVSWTEEVGRIHGVEPGYKPKLEEALNFYAPESRPAVEAVVQKAAETGEPYDLEALFIPLGSKDKIWVRSLGKAVYSGGEIVKLAGIFQNIDKYKRAEEALRESEERFRTLSASAPVGIFLMDDKGQVIYTNERLQAIAGVLPGGGPVEQLATAVHPDDRERMLAEATRQQEGPAELSQEFRILTPQGETRWVRMHVCPILSTDGRQSGVVGTIEDITEQRQAEETLRESEEKYRDLFENASDLIQSVAADGPFVYVNPAWRETLGYSEEEIGGLSFMDIIHPDSKAHCAELFERVMAGERVDHIEAMFVTKEGKTIAVEGSAGGTVKDGEIVGTRGIFRDISERQRAEEERRKAYESIVLLLATAAEARDPYTEDHLYRIRGFAEAIATELGLPPDEIREIGLSSLLHDLGKMRVPDSILTKPGPLSQAEWKIMKQHPLWGEELLSAHPWLETARQIARWHHERWDGTGYPDGLRAERIPLSAAIVTVADALDAMISERPYKGAWPQQQAVREIRMQKGRHFSPDVVEAFNRALRKGEIKRVTDATLRLSKLARAA